MFKMFENTTKWITDKETKKVLKIIKLENIRDKKKLTTSKRMGIFDGPLTAKKW